MPYLCDLVTRVYRRKPTRTNAMTWNIHMIPTIMGPFCRSGKNWTILSKVQEAGFAVFGIRRNKSAST